MRAFSGKDSAAVTVAVAAAEAVLISGMLVSEA